MESFKEFLNQNQAQPAQKTWKATKEDIVGFWKNLRPNVPITMKPIDYNHIGSTYGEDGLRLTGSPQFITSVLGKVKEFLNFETPSTKLSLSYRQTKSPSQAIGPTKTSYVFYVQMKNRGNS